MKPPALNEAPLPWSGLPERASARMKPTRPNWYGVLGSCLIAARTPELRGPMRWPARQ